MIALLAPAAAIAVATAALPVAVHLLTARNARRRSFPALAFVLRAHAGRARISRLRELAVLALRALAIVLVALALAAPLWRSNAAVAGAPTVVVVDASASLRQSHGGASAWTLAAGEARRIVDRAEGPVQVLVAGDEVVRSSPEPVADRGPARALLAAAGPGWGGGSVPEAVATALARLKVAGGDLWLVGDGSRGAWSGVDPGAVPAGVRFHPVAAGGGDPNLAVRALTCAPGTAMAGRPFTLGAEVANYGPADARVTMLIAVGDEQRRQELSVPAGATAAALEVFTAPAAGGLLPASAAIIASDRADAWADDDRRDGVVEAVPAMPVAVVSDGDAGDPRGALKPLLAALAAAGMRPHLVPGKELAAVAAGGAEARPGATPILVTVALAGLPEPALLARHLLAGGAWLQVITGEADARLSTAVPDLVAPLKPGPLVDLSSREHGIRLGQARFDHPLLAGLSGRAALLAEIEAWRYRPAVAGEGAAVLVAWADGSPALAERSAGSGRWLALDLSPAEADSTFASLDTLPLLLEPLGRVLLPPRRADCARPCANEVPAPTALAGPDGTVPLLDGACRLGRPGLYRGGELLVAAAIPALESDLRVVPPPGATAGDGSVATAPAGGEPLWSWCLAAALVLLAAELLLAGGTGRGS